MDRRSFLHSPHAGLAPALLVSSLGAVPAQARETPESVFSVKNHGAKGTGSADDTAAIQAAIDAASAAGGGIVFFPKGAYKTTAGLRCSAHHVSLVGVGHASALHPTGNFDTIRFAGKGHLYGNRVEDLLLQESGKTGGHGLVGDHVAQFHAMRVYAGTGWNGWHFHNFNNVTLDHCRFENYRGEYYGRATGGGAGPGKGRSDVLRLFSIVCGGARKAGMIGIDIDGFVHTVNGWGVHFVSIGAQALLARNSLGAENPPAFFTFDDLECDYPGMECIRLEDGIRFFFNNVQVHGSQGAANIFVGRKARSVSFTGGFSTGAWDAGISIGGHDVALSAMHFNTNSAGAHSRHPGIFVRQYAREVTITGCRSGGEASAGWQAAGCLIEQGADGFVVTGNNFRHNVRGIINGAGFGPSRVVANNV